MRKHLFYLCIALFLVACSQRIGSAPSLSKGEQPENERPNIIVIIADDAGYADFGFMGSKDLDTPRLDSLARDGVVFTDAHVSATVCAPSRAGLLTGQYQQRFGFEANGTGYGGSGDIGLGDDVTTLADVLQRNDYRTIAIGKWHLGGTPSDHPNNRGFDEFYGFLAGGRSYFPLDNPSDNQRLQQNGERVVFDGYLTDVLGDRSVTFVEENQDRPFFMYLSYNAVHTPMEAKASDLEKYRDHSRRHLAAMTWSLDENIGKLRDKLRELDLLDNTLIYFLSDNGGAHNNDSDNAPLKGWKGNKFEGGQRVPFVVSWPARIAGGREFDGLTSSLDIFRTSLAAAAIEPAAGLTLDGVDLLPYLTGTKTGDPHEALYWRKLEESAARIGDYKLIRLRDYGATLYNLATDPAEQNDLAATDTPTVDRLATGLADWEANLMAPLWAEEPEWMEVTYHIHQRLMRNKAALYQSPATDYYVHPEYGNDAHPGTSRQRAFRTLERASRVDLRPGDRILLAAGVTHYGGLRLVDRHGAPGRPITVTSVDWDRRSAPTPASIDFTGEPNGVLIAGSSYVRIANLRLTGNGFDPAAAADYGMRCGVLVLHESAGPVRNIALEGLSIFDVFYENEGFTRGKDEVRTANGTQRYGWGIRVINQDPETPLDSVRIENCVVRNVAHTGIKFTGSDQNIRHIYVAGNEVRDVGGPGIQLSGVQEGRVVGNTVSHTGSTDDTRKWGRGSGLWTWGSSRILIEKNSFLYANGPGDSAGAHIDFNCDNIILQYNLSAYNAGGFCEVLGNTYQCAYRYNVSINDGYRKKGVDGAFQEGKTFWLSGYQGGERPRKGPVNFYFYNNTIYCDSTHLAKIAVDNTSNGVFIANNIFYLRGGAKLVLGDQYKPDTETDQLAENVFFRNNLFLSPSSWPAEIGIQDSAPVFGDPGFVHGGGTAIEDYRPTQVDLIRHQGIPARLLPADTTGLWQPLRVDQDILGRPVSDPPGMGAVERE